MVRPTGDSGTLHAR